MSDDAACAPVSEHFGPDTLGQAVGTSPGSISSRHVTLEWSAGRRQGSAMMWFPFHTAATPGEPGDRDGAGAAVALARLAVVAASLGLGWCMDASAEAPPKKSDSIQVTADQLRQLSVVKVETRPFRLEKSAVGQIAYNEDASTAVLRTFYGRVRRLVGTPAGTG